MGSRAQDWIYARLSEVHVARLSQTGPDWHSQNGGRIFGLTWRRVVPYKTGRACGGLDPPLRGVSRYQRTAK
jgi:hypothetical protein